MMARTSWRRTSNETPFKALTPPKASETPSTASSTSPTGWPRSPRLCGAPRCHGRESSCFGDLQVGRDLARAAVLVAHLRLDMHALAAVVQRGDERRVLFSDEAPAHLARARQLLVVGIELLVQDEEAMDLRVGDLGLLRQIGVHLLDALAHQRAYLVVRGKVDVAGIGEVALLGPVGDRLHVDVDEGARRVVLVAEADRLLDIREELELVLEILRGEERAVGQR